MNVLIGTPIHQVKDYCMERWLLNVSKLQREYPADLLLVDNSPGLDYMVKVRGYCRKVGITKYQLTHINFTQGMSVSEKDMRVEASQEVIRQEVLAHGYDAWFSWECDQIIPANALDKLVDLIESGNFMMVVHNSWARNNPDEFNPDMGVTLIRKDCLKIHGFLPKDGSGHWQGGNRWFKERIFRAGGNYLDMYGVIEPIYHVNK